MFWNTEETEHFYLLTICTLVYMNFSTLFIYVFLEVLVKYGKFETRLQCWHCFLNKITNCFVFFLPSNNTVSKCTAKCLTFCLFAVVLVKWWRGGLISKPQLFNSYSSKTVIIFFNKHILWKISFLFGASLLIWK